MGSRTLELRFVVRTGLLVVVLATAVWIFVDQVRGRAAEPAIPFDRWYGDWRKVSFATGLFTLFLFAFARPLQRREWRHAGLYSAFLISLFTEMFGIPLTIYLLSSLLGLPVQGFGLRESHLWAYLLWRLGLIPLAYGVWLIMLLSAGLIALGVCLVALGWHHVYAARNDLATSGLYGLVRHPQYLGLILTVVGFLVMWPTLPTVLMAPILIAMYLRLGRREDIDLEERFGPAFRAYSERVPAFLPWPRPRPALRKLGEIS